MGDQALFHVVLLSAAIHVNFVNGIFTSPETAYHKLKTIQTVNEKLRHSPTAVSDHMIHAVLFMAMCEVSFVTLQLY
jgi:hypothetical protein